MPRLPIFLRALGLLLTAALAQKATADQSPWDSSIDAVTKARFIPVELWTGMEWDGKKGIEHVERGNAFWRSAEQGH